MFQIKIEPAPLVALDDKLLRLPVYSLHPEYEDSDKKYKHITDIIWLLHFFTFLFLSVSVVK